jgi:hypothetical protein
MDDTNGTSNADSRIDETHYWRDEIVWIGSDNSERSMRDWFNSR